MSKKGKNTGDVYSSEFKDDCEDFIPIPDTLGKRKRIIAIGDVHGDLNLTINYLLISTVIKKTKDTKEILKVTYEDGTEENYKWIGDNTIVVQVGDQVDRCRPTGGRGDMCIRDKKATIDDEHSDIKILDLFNELNKLAIKEDGMVISLLGNHELMNYQGNIN